MSYDLSFDRKTATLLALCTAATVFLLVTAGFLLGAQYRHSSHSTGAAPAAPATRPSTAVAAPIVAAPIVAAPIVAAPIPSAPSAPSASKPDSAASVQVDAPAAPSADPESLSAKAPAAAGYSLQFGAFHDEANAEAMIKQLKEKNVKAAVVPREDAAGATWYTVRFGDYPTLAAASTAAAPLRLSTQQSVFVRPSSRP
ncbi:MAG: SPOR domain-containing protein [Edaphobacter sp.]